MTHVAFQTLIVDTCECYLLELLIFWDKFEYLNTLYFGMEGIAHIETNCSSNSASPVSLWSSSKKRVSRVPFMCSIKNLQLHIFLRHSSCIWIYLAKKFEAELKKKMKHDRLKRTLRLVNRQKGINSLQTCVLCMDKIRLRWFFEFFLYNNVDWRPNSYSMSAWIYCPCERTNEHTFLSLLGTSE